MANENPNGTRTPADNVDVLLIQLLVALALSRVVQGIGSGCRAQEEDRSLHHCTRAHPSKTLDGAHELTMVLLAAPAFFSLWLRLAYATVPSQLLCLFCTMPLGGMCVASQESHLSIALVIILSLCLTTLWWLAHAPSKSLEG
ncbi:hypothetical protein PLICRDRAFT_319626 [Plicaturopsis crispa FD-325 SS-3]|nr:hypothetical protein PLICRDRAFT_319626 [Plicaturopsis crispa FD-325 SS-3]